MANINIGEFNISVTRKDVNLYDAYISHDGNSGENHEDVSAERIGEIVADLIDCIAESY